jgi:hypothetical protein
LETAPKFIYEMYQPAHQAVPVGELSGAALGLTTQRGAAQQMRFAQQTVLDQRLKR